MKGKILCPAGCQNPVARITKAKENLKNPRSAGSWRPFKCIFGERKKGRPQRAGTPVPFALCTEKPGQGQTGAVHVHRVQGHFLIVGGGTQDLQVKLLDDLAQGHAVLALAHAKPFLSFAAPSRERRFFRLSV